MKRYILKEAGIMSFAATAQEEAERINSQTGAGYVTDQAFWERQGITTGEELAFEILSQTYSDLHKSLHGIRPRWARFETCQDVQNAINALDREAEQIMRDQEWEAKREAEWDRERKELEDLQAPGCDLDYERVPRFSGMGRRNESLIRISKSQLRKIIKEEKQRLINRAHIRAILKKELLKH